MKNFMAIMFTFALALILGACDGDNSDPTTDTAIVDTNIPDTIDLMDLNDGTDDANPCPSGALVTSGCPLEDMPDETEEIQEDPCAAYESIEDYIWECCGAAASCMDPDKCTVEAMPHYLTGEIQCHITCDELTDGDPISVNEESSEWHWEGLPESFGVSNITCNKME